MGLRRHRTVWGVQLAQPSRLLLIVLFVLAQGCGQKASEPLDQAGGSDQSDMMDRTGQQDLNQDLLLDVRQVPPLDAGETTSSDPNELDADVATPDLPDHTEGVGGDLDGVQGPDLDVTQPPDTDADVLDAEIKPDDVLDIADADDLDAEAEVVIWPDIPCCFPTPNVKGCDDQQIRDCVCEQDSYCCAISWDENCVAEVATYKCGTCTEVVTCGDGTCHETEHCEDCPQDCGSCPSICGDAICELPDTCETCPQDCGVCLGSTCCKSQSTPGCDQPAVQACVCAEDSYCCAIVWDSNCVAEIAQYGCGKCQ